MASNQKNTSDQDEPEQKHSHQPAKAQGQQETRREDPVEADDVGTAKETTTIRGHGESQSVRHSG